MNEKYFESVYNLIGYYNLPQGNLKKLFIGKKSPKLCRYCKRNQEETSFKTCSHAIPEFLGNKTLISYDECDQCNAHFAKHVEQHLTNYLGAYRTLVGIKGKKSIPKYKSKDKKFEMYASKEDSSIVCDESKGEHLDWDEPTKTMKISTIRQPYVPAAVYKCFVKMAVAIAPEELLGEMGSFIHWILEKEHNTEIELFQPLVIFEHFTTGGRSYPGIKLYLLRRKSDDLQVPYLQFVCSFGNSSYQIVLPIRQKDGHLDNNDIELCMFPTPYDNDATRVTSTKMLDLSSCNVVRDEIHDLFIQFDDYLAS